MVQKKREIKRGTAAESKSAEVRPETRCGLCGKSKNLTRTECCGEWICDDADEYVLFSYARNSCYRNHDRYTLCSSHYNEGHKGNWQTCQKCREGFETEIYVYFGTNEYNFVKLENPPKFKPTRCAKCKRVINLAEGGFSMKSGGYYCERCSGLDLSKLFSR
jgi:hypothetical protein